MTVMSAPSQVMRLLHEHGSSLLLLQSLHPVPPVSSKNFVKPIHWSRSRPLLAPVHDGCGGVGLGVGFGLGEGVIGGVGLGVGFGVGEGVIGGVGLGVGFGVGGGGAGGVGDTQSLAHAADELNCPLLPAICLHCIDGNKQSYVVEGGNGGTGLHLYSVQPSHAAMPTDVPQQ